MTANITQSENASTLPHKLNYFTLIFVTYLALLFVSVGFLYFSSYKSVSHGVHAVKVGKNPSSIYYIHGSKLECEPFRRGDKCQITLWSDKILTIETQPVGTMKNAILNCRATYAGKSVSCEKYFPTNSYWSHGVVIDDDDVLLAFIANGLSLFHWQHLMFGVGEKQAIILAWVLAIGIPLLAVIITPFVIGRFTNWLPPFSFSLSNFLAFLLTLSMLTIPSIILFFYAIFAFGFVD